VLVLQEDVLSIKRRKKKRCWRLALGGGQTTDATLVAGRHLIVAQGSTLLKCYNQQKSEDEARALSVACWPKHEVLQVSACVNDGERFIAAARGAAVSVWAVDPDQGSLKLEFVLHGHASSVGAVYLGASVAAAADRDGILKAWRLPEPAQEPEEVSTAVLTLRAHEKEVTCLAGRAEDALVVSCSPVSFQFLNRINFDSINRIQNRLLSCLIRPFFLTAIIPFPLYFPI